MPVLTYYEAKQRLAKGDSPSFLLLQGGERFLRRELIGDLRRHLEARGGSVDYVEWEESAGDAEICQMLATVPFGSGRRMAVLHNPPDAAMENYLRIADPSVVLVLLCNERIQPPHKVYRLLAEKGWVVDCSPLRGRDLVRWIVEEVRSQKKEILPSAIEYLRFLCGDQPARIHQEIEKASLYLGRESKAITVDVLKDVGSAAPERSIFELADAVAEGKTDLVREILAQISARGEPPVLVVNLLSRHLLQLLEMACLIEEGVRPQKVPEIMGVQPFLAKKMYQQLHSLSVAKLEWLIEALLELDAAIKQGRGNPQLLLEAALIEICIKIKKPLTLQGKR